MIQFIINDNVKNLILLQRTGYGTTDTNQVSSIYYKDMVEAFEHFSKKIKNCSNVLDIGCGIGGIDVIISKKYPDCKFYLVDRDGIENKVFYGFREKGAKYNYLSTTRRFMTENHVPDNNIHTYNVEQGEWPTTKFDVIISLLSWGFHYPVSTYVEKVKESMNDDAILVIDIRHESGGLEELKQFFDKTEIVHTFTKHDRVIAYKNI